MRQPPTITCSGCGQRTRKKGAIRSKATGRYWCRDCMVKTMRGEK